MSVLETTNRQVPLGAVAIFRGVSLVERALAFVSAWGRERATRRALAELSDAQLADIGLTRGQIVDVAQGLVRR
jgi:uncharacterized protein YjiS (DUF1127 family)